MASFYTVHATTVEYDEEMNDSYDLYTTFEKACDAMEDIIRDYVDNDMKGEYDEEIVFERPDRASLEEHLKVFRSVRYFRLPGEPDVLFIIRRMTVKD